MARSRNKYDHSTQMRKLVFTTEIISTVPCYISYARKMRSMYLIPGVLNRASL